MGSTPDQLLIRNAEFAYPLAAATGAVSRALRLGNTAEDRNSLLEALLRVHPGLLAEHLADAHPKRKLHFIAGRLCALNALEAAGRAGAGESSASMIPSREDRSPEWPEGWAGSITHTETLACAVVAPRSLQRSTGIDSETLMSEQSTVELQDRLALPGELEFVTTNLGCSAREALTLIFSGKESIYKAVYPLVGKYFDFLDARIVEVTDGRFQALLSKDLDSEFRNGTLIEGRFICSGEEMHTAVEIR